MAAANLIARFEAKLDALSDQLGNQLRRERAMLWALIVLLGAAVLRDILAGLG